MKCKENWEEVVDYEGWYEISDLGRGKRVKAALGTTVGLILKPFADKNNCQQFDLHKNGKGHTMQVHRIVMAAFVGPCPEGKEVNHIDGDRGNNRLDNLEYVTHSENVLHAFRIGLLSRKGEKNSQCILTEDNVHEIRRLIGRETHKTIANMFGVSTSTICAIASGQNWSWLKEDGEEDD